MKKEAIIEIKTAVTVEGDTDEFEMVTRGNVLKSDGELCLSYKESDEFGYNGCTVLIRIEDDRKVTVHRVGDVRSHLIIEKGKRTVSAYGTLHGAAMLGVGNVSIDTEYKKDSYEISVSYELDVDLVVMSKNKLFIKVRECND